MEIQIAHVDLSALGILDTIRAGAGLCHALDPHYGLRMGMGASLAPPKIMVCKIAPGLLQLTKVVV